jgi:hypothetical protein
VRKIVILLMTLSSAELVDLGSGSGASKVDSILWVSDTHHMAFGTSVAMESVDFRIIKGLIPPGKGVC